MSFSVLHQLGHRFNWNIECVEKHQCGDGLIVAPRYMARDKVEALDSELLKSSIFDPQFFLPNTPKGSLDSYEFFPDVISSGFETGDFVENAAKECARKCIEFQNEMDFEAIVIPTRYFEGTPSDFIASQKEQFVSPFIEELDSINKANKPVLIQLVLNDLMVKDSEYMADILNWVTGLKIEGVYLICENNSTSKQVKDADLLLSLFDTVFALRENGLQTILGYLNTESLLLSIADPTAVTIGAYENLRSFSPKAFRDEEKTPMQGPNPRLYLSNLMQWVEYPYVQLLKRAYPDGDIFDETEYKAEMFKQTYKWHFTKPELYKHHFIVMYKQLKSLAAEQGKSRYELFCDMAKESKEKYNTLSHQGFEFDHNSDGSHISIWLTVANIFAKKMGWK